MTVVSEGGCGRFGDEGLFEFGWMFLAWIGDFQIEESFETERDGSCVSFPLPFEEWED